MYTTCGNAALLVMTEADVYTRIWYEALSGYYNQTPYRVCCNER